MVESGLTNFATVSRLSGSALAAFFATPEMLDLELRAYA